MVYTPHVWVNGTTPAINATHLNEMEAGIVAAGSGSSSIVTAVVASSDQSLATSSTTLQNLTGLVLTLNGVATQIWWLEMYLVFSAANATMDGKLAFTVPSGCTGYLGGLNSANQSFAGCTWAPQLSASSPTALAGLTTAQSFGSANVTFGLAFGAIVFDGGTGGAVQLQAAQNTSDSGLLTLKTGSFMRITRLV